MVARATRSLLLALVCLVVGEPLHGWLHAGGATASGPGLELHDGACEHQTTHPSDDDCLQCSGGRAGPAARIDHVVGWRHLTRHEARAPIGWAGPTCCSAPHRLGARAPPILG